MSVPVCERAARSNGVSPSLDERPTKKTKTDGEGALQVKRLSANATLPTRGSPHAAGYDLYRCALIRYLLASSCILVSRHFLRVSLSAKDICILAEGKALVPTDIAVAIPEGCYGRVGKWASLSLSLSLSLSIYIYIYIFTSLVFPYFPHSSSV